MLKQKVLRNIKLGTKYGEVTIDNKGVIKGLTEEQEKSFKDLPWYFYTPDKKAPVKAKGVAKTTSTTTTTRRTTRKPRASKPEK